MYLPEVVGWLGASFYLNNGIVGVLRCGYYRFLCGGFSLYLLPVVVDARLLKLVADGIDKPIG